MKPYYRTDSIKPAVKSGTSFIAIILICVAVFSFLSEEIAASSAKNALSPETLQNDWYESTLTPESIFADMSYLNDPPAGKHGFLEIKGDRFIFEDGTETRFWGIALSAASCFPSKQEAPLIAKRLAALGFNMVRLHHMDASWNSLSLIDYKNHNDSRHFNYESWDRLDYFISLLKQEGIYIYIDLFVSREFKDGDGIINAAALPYQGKGATIIDPHLIVLQKDFAAAIWNHINPYTGLRYKNEPAIALTLITNENDLTSHYFLTPDHTPEHPALSRLFTSYLDSYAAENNLNKKKTRQVWKTPEGKKAANKIMIDYFTDMHQFLRDLGVRIPVTGTNWASQLYDLPALASTDFIDQHIYVKGDSADADFRTSPFKAATTLQSQSFARVKGMPFVVSEWNMDYPKEYRAEYPLTFAAIAAYQGWNATILYDYSHDTWVQSFLHHPNDVVIDPARITLLPAAALLFRSAVKPAGESRTLKVSEEELYTAHYKPEDMLAYRTGLWQHRLSLSWNNKDDGISPLTNLMPFQAADVKSADGQLFWDWQDGYRLIDTPTAQAAVGTGSGNIRKTNDISFRIDNEFFAGAVISPGSNAAPINKADKLFIFITSKADNHHSLSDVELTDSIKYSGSARIMSEIITGSILIRNSNKEVKYRTILPSGKTGKSGSLSRSGEYWVLPLNRDDRAFMYEVSSN